MQILEAHLANCENSLLATSKVPSTSGHPLHKGTPREAFIKKFLSDHLPADFAIGTGELIDYRSEEKEKRNQHDIVIFESSFPRIHFGGGINAYLRESAVATIEVKSTLDEKEMLKAIKVAQKAKQLQASGSLPILPIANYIVAYGGPAKMETVFGWISQSYRKLKLCDPDFGHADRRFIASAALDGVYILGVGACIFENNIGFSQNYSLAYPTASWSIVDTDRGALFLLFAALLGLVHASDFREINPWKYTTGFRVASPRFARIYADRSEIFPLTSSS
jgi:hypothetical protein